MNVAELAQLLSDAKDAHAAFEVQNGPDPDWPRWYAWWMLPRLNDEGREASWHAGIVFRPGSLWVGAHWSKYNRRLCLNLLPMVTIWFTLPGGKPGTGWRLR